MAETSNFGGSLTAKVNSTKLKELRGNRKQSDIEVACGIPKGQLTRSENNKPLSIKHIIKLGEFHKVHPNELLSEEGMRTTGELLTDLATLRGVKIDFGAHTNGVRPGLVQV